MFEYLEAHFLGYFGSYDIFKLNIININMTLDILLKHGLQEYIIL